jgi:catechol 2,3-dioxygenase-like lactoylglutathione lyase family enzyme
MRKIKSIYNESIRDNDLCARSGLNSVMFFVGLYVFDMQASARFYKDVLGEDAVRFESEEATSFIVEGELELFLQQVDTDSAFAELIGSQTVGLNVTTERFSQITGNLPDTVQLDVETWTGGPGLDEGVLVSDPEGNRLLFTPAAAPSLVS